MSRLRGAPTMRWLNTVSIARNSAIVCDTMVSRMAASKDLRSLSSAIIIKHFSACFVTSIQLAFYA